MIKLIPKQKHPSAIEDCFEDTPPLFSNKRDMHVWVEENRYDDIINPFAFCEMEWIEQPKPKSNLNPALFSSGDLEGSYEWATPQKLFDQYHAKHWYEVDLAASILNTKLPVFIGPDDSTLPEYMRLCKEVQLARKRKDLQYAKELKEAAILWLRNHGQDSLQVPWASHWRVGWLNPPYGRGVGEWVEKAYTEIQKGMTQITMLLPVRTDTEWFHKWIYKAYKNKGGGVQAAIIFLEGRVMYELNGEPMHPAPFPSMICHLYRYRSPYTEGGM